MTKTALVTGGSSGIGASAAKALLSAGYRVFALSRGGACAGEIEGIAADVTDTAAAADAIKRIEGEAGGLDLLVNCAGFGISGAAEFTLPEDAARQMDVNLMGTANMCAAALPLLRKSRGRIINISSVAAVTPIPFQTWYTVSKAGINAYTAALANEVRRFGVSVCAVMPGDTHTGFTDARKKNTGGGEVYGEIIQKSVERMEHDERGGTSPDVTGRFICKVAQKRNVKPYYTVGGIYKFFVVLVKILPCRFSNYIIGKMYA